MGMVNSFEEFSKITANKFTRKWGGNSNVVNPYITGYFFVDFVNLPLKNIGNSIALASTDTFTDAQIKDGLASACLSVTLPGATVNTTEFTGLGGVKYNVPTNVDWDTTASFRFLEMSGLPILNIMHGWVRLIRSYRSGVAAENLYHKSDYAGSCYYWTTAPDGLSVEYACCLSGIFPKKDPTDMMGHDLAANDKLEIDIDFNVDYIWREQWVYTIVASKAITYHDEGQSMVSLYGPNDANAL